MQKVLDESKDAEVSSHYTGGNIYGDSNAEIYTSVNAKYLSTDYLVAQTAKSYGTTLDNNREEVSAQVFSHLQNLQIIWLLRLPNPMVQPWIIIEKKCLHRFFRICRICFLFVSAEDVLDLRCSYFYGI